MVIEPAQSEFIINAFEMLATKKKHALPRSMVIFLYSYSKVLATLKETSMLVFGAQVAIAMTIVFVLCSLMLIIQKFSFFIQKN